MKKLTLLLAIVGAALVPAASASAGGPSHVSVTITVSTPSPNFSCSPYGYSFNVLATFTVTRDSQLFYDDNGNLTKEIRHVDFTGTLYRSDDLSATIPYAGRWQRTLDVAANTITSTGLMRYSHPDGSGMVSSDPGQTVVDASTFNTLSDTASTNADWQSGVCAYLAAE